MSFDAVIKKSIDDVKIGDIAHYAKTVNEANIMMFAQLTGDYAPHHVSKVFGETTMFGTRIAHGMITVGLIGPMLTKLCGDASVTVFQNIRFRSAVALGETVNVTGTITEIDRENSTVTVDVVCERYDKAPEDRPYITAVFKQKIL